MIFLFLFVLLSVSVFGQYESAVAGLSPVSVVVPVVNPTASSYVYVNISSPSGISVSPFNLSAFANKSVLLEWVPSSFGTFTHFFNVSFFSSTVVSQSPVSVVMQSNGSGLFPSVVSVPEGSTVLVNNTVSQSISIVDNSSLGVVNVSGFAVGSLSYPVGVWSFVVEPYGFVGVVNVSSGSVPGLLHDPTLDSVFSWQVLVSSVSQNVSLSLLTPNLTVEWNGSRQGVLEVETFAHGNVSFRSVPDWLSFSRNDFGLFGQDLVTFVVSPVLNSSEQTNRSYNVSVEVVDAAGVVSRVPLSVFVPFSNVSLVSNVSAGHNFVFVTEEMLESFCESFPDRCPKTVVRQVQYVNRSPTEAELDLADLEDRVARVNNDVNAISGQLNELKSDVRDSRLSVDSLSNNVSVQVQQRLDEISRSRTLRRILFFSLLSSVVLVGLVFGIRFFKNYSDDLYLPRS